MNAPPVSNNSSSSSPVIDDRPTLKRQHDSPDHSIYGNQAPVLKGGDATVNDRTGLYLAIIALVFAGMGLGFEISRAMSGTEVQRLQDQAVAERQRQQDQLIDARIQAGAAAALAKANASEVNARVALDKVQNIKVELAKRGITIKDD